MLRLASAGLVLCAVSVSTSADPITSTFDVTGGQVTWVTSIDGSSSTSSLAGMFTVTIDQSDGHIGASDTFVLEEGDIYNTDAMSVPYLPGIWTAVINPGDQVNPDSPSGVDGLHLLDFQHNQPGHIAAGGSSTLDLNTYGEVWVDFTDLSATPFYISHWSDSAAPFALQFSTSVGLSDVLTVSLRGTDSWVFDLGQYGVLTWDFILDVEGTAHVVPEPVLGGSVVMGLFGAGAWLRRRRRWRPCGPKPAALT